MTTSPTQIPGAVTAGGHKNRRGWASRLMLSGCVLFLLILALGYFVYILPFWGVPFNQGRHGRVPLTPPWALECWVWEDDLNTGAYVTELLEGYASHDIPVRTILIDSPWSWRYNDFKVDEERYPEPAQFFSGLQEKGYRVVLWMTCMVDSSSKDTKFRDSLEFFESARNAGFLAGNGAQIKWWKGRGGFIDYSNPEGLKWWHGLQQQVLDWGVDGWKLDGADTLFSSKWWKLPVPLNRTHSGWMTTRQYMDHYARNEYQNGVKNNPDFAVLIRAKDGPWTHPEGFAPLDAAPVTWVGDNQHTWSKKRRGLERAILDILSSAKLGYCVIGSDVAGYHGQKNPEDIGAATTELISAWRSEARIDPVGADVRRPGAETLSSTPAQPPDVGFYSSGASSAFGDDPIPPNIYIRWAQFSAFCGLFLNGGHGERRLWKRTPAELEIIRKFAWLHTELVPYMYSHVATCHRGGPPLMRRTGREEYDYFFGDDFFVAPIHEDKLSRTVQLPAGNWRYLFADGELLQGPAKVTREFPLDQFPVFIREGAIVPLTVSRSYTGFGDRNSAGFMTWLIYPQGQSEFTLYHPETHPNPEQTTVKVELGKELRIGFSGKREPHILRIFCPMKPATVRLDGSTVLEQEGWKFEPQHQRLTIRTAAYQEGNYIVSWR